MLYKSIKITLLSLAITPCFAAYFTVTQSPELSFPASMYADSQVASDYIIKDVFYHNTSPAVSPISAHIKIPAGYLAVPAVNLSNQNAPACGIGNNFSLGPDKPMCTLRLIYNSDSQLGLTKPVAVPLVCPSLKTNVGCAQLLTKQSFNIVERPKKPPVQIELTNADTRDNAFFAPGETRWFAIKNISPSQMTADHIHIAFQPALQNYVNPDSKLACDTLAYGETCLLKVNMKNTLPLFKSNMSYDIEGRNTNQIKQFSQVMPSLMRMNNVSFTKKGSTAALTLSNEGDKTVTLPTLSALQSALSNLKNLTGITLLNDPNNTSSCLSTVLENKLISHTTCHYTLNSADSASGHGNLLFNYTPDGKTTAITRSVPIVVHEPSVQITSPRMDQYHNILAENTDGGTLTITNKKGYDWKKPSVTFVNGAYGTNYHLGHISCGDVIKAGQNCTLQYALNTNATKPTFTSLKISGANTQTQYKTVFPKNQVSIAPASSEDQHMSYIALDIANNTNSFATLLHITPIISSNLHDVVVCNQVGSHCARHYHNTCHSGAMLRAYHTCQIWFKMKNVRHFIKNNQGSLQLSVDIKSSNKNGKHLYKTIQSPILHVKENEGLYAGGTFTHAAGNDNINSIAYFDGTNWQPVSSEAINGTVQTILPWEGDLYIGGTTSSTAGNYLVLWNGTTVYALSGGIQSDTNNQNDGVYALYANTPDGNSTAPDSLLVGGNFQGVSNNDSGAIPVPNSQYIANWLGANWAALSEPFNPTKDYGGIKAITTLNNGNIVVGGDFTNVKNASDNNNTSYIAQLGLNWDSLNLNDNNDNTDVNNSIYAFYKTNIDARSSSYPLIYAFGVFSKVNSGDGYVAQQGLSAFNQSTGAWLTSDGNLQTPSLTGIDATAYTAITYPFVTPVVSNGKYLFTMAGLYSGSIVNQSTSSDTANIATLTLQRGPNPSTLLQGLDESEQLAAIQNPVYALSPGVGNPATCMYVGGDFTINNTNAIAKWCSDNPTEWQPVGTDTDFNKYTSIYTLVWAPNLSIER